MADNVTKEFCEERHTNTVEHLDRQDAQLERILRLLEGNGTPGLKSDIETLKSKVGVMQAILVLVGTTAISTVVVWGIGKLLT